MTHVRCPQYLSILSRRDCALRWSRANGTADKSATALKLALCRGCHVGAAHACGDRSIIESAPAPVPAGAPSTKKPSPHFKHNWLKPPSNPRAPKRNPRLKTKTCRCGSTFESDVPARKLCRACMEARLALRAGEVGAR